MPKSRFKMKKSIITSATTILGLTEELESTLCCSQRARCFSRRLTRLSLSLSVLLLGNCPSHWQDRLTEKLKILQQSKLKLASSTANKCQPKKRRSRHLPHSSILSPLFRVEEQQQEANGGLYSEPVPKNIVLEKHRIFATHVAEALENSVALPSCFTRTNLQPQMQYRMVSLVADPFSDQVGREGWRCHSDGLSL